MFIYFIWMFWRKKKMCNLCLAIKAERERKKKRKGTANSVRIRAKSKVKRWRICAFTHRFGLWFWFLFEELRSRRHLLFCEKWLLPTFADWRNEISMTLFERWSTLNQFLVTLLESEWKLMSEWREADISKVDPSMHVLSNRWWSKIILANSPT